MALVDALETQLTASRATAANLLSAIWFREGEYERIDQILELLLA